jgi:hypothetical protein
MMRVAKSLAVILLAGAICWLPSIALHWLHRSDFDGADASLLTVLIPVFSYFALLLSRLLLPAPRRYAFVGFLVTVGLWFVGPWAMFISATASGGGLAATSTPSELLILLIPGIAFIFATYDGSLFGLLLSTMLIFVLSIMRSHKSALQR